MVRWCSGDISHPYHIINPSQSNVFAPVMTSRIMIGSWKL